MDTGLVIELWNKGILWDKMIGCIWVPLEKIHFSEQPNDGQWMQVDADLEIYNGEICGTRNPTGHVIHIEMHFEPVYGMFIRPFVHSFGDGFIIFLNHQQSINWTT